MSLQRELSSIQDHLSELEMELDEHTMVLNALTPLEPGRRCHRRVGAILMESTVEKVIPNITEIIKGLQSNIETTKTQLREKEKEHIKALASQKT